MDIFEYSLLGYVIAHLSIHALMVFFKVLFRLYHGGNKALAKTIAPVFILCDAAVNLYSVSLLYRERPHEWLVTARLKRWKKLPANAKGIEKRRRDFAYRTCDELNDYDPGHC